MSITLTEVVQKIRSRQFMSGVDRSKERIQETQEFFTPAILVREVLDYFDQDLFQDPVKTFLDPTCGDGEMLGEVLIRKMEHGATFEQALSTIYGTDLMQDNVLATRDHLLCGQEHLRHIVERNIVAADVLQYNFLFDHKETAADGLIEYADSASVPAKPKKQALNHTGEVVGDLFSGLG